MVCCMEGAYVLDVPPPPLEAVLMQSPEYSWAHALYVAAHALMLNYNRGGILPADDCCRRWKTVGQAPASV